MIDESIVVNGKMTLHEVRRERLDSRDVYRQANEWSCAVEALGFDALEATHALGVSPGTMAEWLAGRRSPTADAWRRLRSMYAVIEHGAGEWALSNDKRGKVTCVQPDDRAMLEYRKENSCKAYVGSWRMVVGRAILRSRARVEVLSTAQDDAGDTPGRVRRGRPRGSEPNLPAAVQFGGATGAECDRVEIPATTERADRGGPTAALSSWPTRLLEAVRACGEDAVKAADAMGRVRDGYREEPTHVRVARLPDLADRIAEATAFCAAWREAFVIVLEATDGAKAGRAVR